MSGLPPLQLKQIMDRLDHAPVRQHQRSAGHWHGLRRVQVPAAEKVRFGIGHQHANDGSRDDAVAELPKVQAALTHVGLLST
ncbi:hypothetical protein ACFQU2_42175 [Siccirubricoccus deserti]